MARVLLFGCWLSIFAGCASYRAPSKPDLENPLVVPAGPCDSVWDQIVDIVDDDFNITSEQRVRPAGDILTVGRIDTAPTTGATVFEPWRGDAADGYERLHGTLQTVRRRAVVQVVPIGGAFQVEVTVFKELEDLGFADYSTAGIATFRNDDSLKRIEEPVGAQPTAQGWIPLGRDTALEQKILAKVAMRLGRIGGQGILGLPDLTNDLPPGAIIVPGNSAGAGEVVPGPNGTLPPGTLPPGTVTRESLPPGALPPGMPPPSVVPGTLPPGALPPGGFRP
jgi:hypothetical protein